MTQILPGAARQGPGMHALILGVGKYPHLIEGDGDLADKPLGLGQLTSPPLSAAHFIDWCLGRLPGSPGGYINAAAPPASVEVLVSAPTPLQVNNGQGLVTVQAATLANVQAAFRAWLLRLKQDDNNIGVFYFCGHGIAVPDQYLLLEDFGADSDQPWDRAFDLTNTIRAVEREVKGTAYFFIDACREISLEVATTLGANPRALKVVVLRSPVLLRSSSLIFATGEGKLAFAPKDTISRFTQALVTALSGYAGIKEPGAATWGVDGEILAPAVRKLLEEENKAAKVPQVSEQAIAGKSVPIVQIPVPPRVKVKVDLSPKTMRVVAQFYLRSATGPAITHNGADGAFLTEVPLGFYDLGVLAAAQQFMPISRVNELLHPPLYSDTWRVQS